MLWWHIFQIVAAIKVGWMGFALTLVSVYVPPLTSPNRSHIIEAGLVPTEAASFTGLGAVLDLLDPKWEPVLIMGNMNAHTAVFAPTVEGQLPHMSVDTVLNTRSHALLSLVIQQELLLLSSMT